MLRGMQLVIPVHSFVDLITNSSSELFICETKKSTETVKQILVELAKLHNERQKHIENPNDPIRVDALFTYYFQEPTVSEFTFDFYKYPRISEWIDMFGNPLRHEGFYYSGDEETHPVLALAEKKRNAWSAANPQPSWADRDELAPAEYDIAAKKWEAHETKRKVAYGRFFKKWNTMSFEIINDLRNWAAKENGLDLLVLGQPAMRVFHGSLLNIAYPNWTEENQTKEMRFVTEIENAMSWGYTIKKGDVFLRSGGDNSVPCSFWSDIEGAFGSVQRRHLG